MQIGFVGLGKMGFNMVARLQRGGHGVVAFDASADVRTRGAAAGIPIVDSLADLAAALPPPRAIWVMVPAGDATESVVSALADRLSADDVIVDGGNTNYKDDVRRAADLSRRRIHYVDAGTSGGVWGLETGFCLMVGGDAEICRRLEPIFHTLAAPGGYLRVGATGAGHYVKMVHNGIEYGLMQAYAEGFQLMEAAGFDLDLPAIASLWMQGSVVRSWLLELTARALAEDPRLSTIAGQVADSGEGRWTVAEAIDRAVPLPVITAALYARFESRADNPFANRLLAALRHQFGGHAVKRVD
jgi:6-phosphogluconate dehydrogenase